MKYCFGVDIGGTTVKMGLFEATGTILEKWEIKTHTEEEGKAILPDVAASLKEKKAEHDLADADIIGSEKRAGGADRTGRGSRK